MENTINTMRSRGDNNGFLGIFSSTSIENLFQFHPSVNPFLETHHQTQSNPKPNTQFIATTKFVLFDTIPVTVRSKLPLFHLIQLKW
ncbi:hypothetical protein P8452_07268 [Trifolium repens]|nr:hypothetical protein P8452_07268 [Trifolium repens]